MIFNWHSEAFVYDFCFWGSRCLLPTICFNAVNTQSGHVSFVCVCLCVCITLYANAASVQSNSLKNNSTIVQKSCQDLNVTEFETYFRRLHLKWYAYINPPISLANLESWLAQKDFVPCCTFHYQKIRNQTCASSCCWLVVTWVSECYFFSFFVVALRHILKLISLAYVDFSLLAL